MVQAANAAPGLSGWYLCDKQQLNDIAELDQKQVYDLRHKDTLESVSIQSYAQIP